MLKVKFSCELCGLKDAEAEVRWRKEGEDVVHYVHQVITDAVQVKHQLLSWGCQSKVLNKLMIPMDSKRGIGFPPDEEQESGV